MTEYVEVTKVMEFTPDEELIEVGKRYEVVEECGGGVYIYAHEKAPKYFLYNDQFKEVKEEKQMKYTENDIKEGTKLICKKASDCWWTTAKVYEVSLGKDGILFIKDDLGNDANLYYMLECLNGNHVVEFEIVNEEEKEMKKYAKITKYAGLIDTDKENGLEIGKEYEIVKFSSVSEDCWVYLNDKRPEYFISETQYELVEKEEAPTLKANVTVDVKEVIQAKVYELRNEAEHLFKKRDRLEQHGINLNKKAQKLKEVIETIKEFE